MPGVVHHPKTAGDAKLPTGTMELASFRQQDLRWSGRQPAFLARSSTGEELVWLSGKEHPSVVDDGQLGLVGHLQPGTCSLGKGRMVPLSVSPWLIAAEPGHPAFAGGKISSVSVCLLGSFSLVL